MLHPRLLATVLVACLPFVVTGPVARGLAEDMADLSIAATASSHRKGAAWYLRWEVDVSNDGPSPAAGVVVEAVADEILRIRLGNLRIEAPSGAECSGPALSCRLGDLRAGDRRRVVVEAEIAGDDQQRSAGLEFRVAANTVDTAPCDNRYYSSTFLE